MLEYKTRAFIIIPKKYCKMDTINLVYFVKSEIENRCDGFVVKLSLDGENLVRLMPFTALLYSSIVGVLPSIADNTTTGVDASKDSPFLRSESATTLP